MTKNTFLDWDTTANNNTDVGGISIAENCPPSNINNGMRETMAQLRAGVDGKVVYAVKVANYTALAADNNAVHRYTATATVTLTAAATLAANWHYTVIADGADVTIDPNGAETIDGAATLVVPNGSSAHIICNGSAFFTVKTIVPLQPFGTVASAGTTDIGAVTSQNVTVTGTTTITSFGTVAAGTFRRLVFSGILTLTYNAASLILPNGGLNITTAAGDSLEAVSLGSGNWRVTSYQQASPHSINLGTSVSASGTAVDITTIPSGVKRVTVMLSGISTTGTDAYRLQIGDSGGIETSGYASGSSAMTGSVSSQNDTSGYGILVGSASAIVHGTVVLNRISGTTWIASGILARSDAGASVTVAGEKTLSDTLDRIRLTTSGGTQTFDAGSINLSWEF